MAAVNAKTFSVGAHRPCTTLHFGHLVNTKSIGRGRVGVLRHDRDCSTERHAEKAQVDHGGRRPYFLVGFMLAPSDIRNRIRTIWDAKVEYQADMQGANASKAGRYEGLLAGLAIFQRFPATGVGIGNFANYREIYIDGVRLDAHNLPGELLGELGFVGTCAFSIFFLAYFLNLRRLSSAGREYDVVTGDPKYRLLGNCLFDAMLLLSIYGLVGHTLQQYQWYFYASFTAIALHIVRKELQELQAQSPLVDVGMEESSP